MEGSENHIIGFKTYLVVLTGLLILTGLSVAITEIELGALSVAAALFFAFVKSGLVLTYFMHLKFSKKIYALFFILVFLVFMAVIVITFLDYIFR